VCTVRRDRGGGKVTKTAQSSFELQKPKVKQRGGMKCFDWEGSLESDSPERHQFGGNPGFVVFGRDLSVNRKKRGRGRGGGANYPPKQICRKGTTNFLHGRGG